MGKKKPTTVAGTSRSKARKPKLVNMKKRKPNQHQTRKGKLIGDLKKPSASVSKKTNKKTKVIKKNSNKQQSPTDPSTSKFKQQSPGTRSSPRFKQNTHIAERILRGRVVKYSRALQRSPSSSPSPIPLRGPSRTSTRTRKNPPPSDHGLQNINVTDDSAKQRSPPKRARAASDIPDNYSCSTESVDDPIVPPAAISAPAPLRGLRRFVGFNLSAPAPAPAPTEPEFEPRSRSVEPVAPERIEEQSETSTLSVDAPVRDTQLLVATADEMRVVMRWLEMAASEGQVRIAPPPGWGAPTFLIKPCASAKGVDDEQVIGAPSEPKQPANDMEETHATNAADSNEDAVTEEEVLDGSGLFGEDCIDAEDRNLDGTPAAMVTNSNAKSAYLFGSEYQKSKAMSRTALSASTTTTITTGALGNGLWKMSNDSPIPAACYKRAWGFTPGTLDEEVLDSGDANDIV